MFSRKKRHYELREWVDFVRGLIGADVVAAMQAHLDGGCAECGEMAGFFSQVAERASADAAYAVPDYAVRNARAVYGLQRPEQVRLLPRTVARLVYDSFREPLLAGVRSQQHPAHQLLYVAGPYCVDLRLERQESSPHVRLIGQIAHREHGAAAVPETPVFLLSRNLVISKTATNKFGEFSMEYAPRKGLRLFAPIPGENHLEIRVGDTSARNHAMKS